MKDKTEIAFELKPYTKKDLRLLMGIPRSTFTKWIATIPEAKSLKKTNWLSTDIVKLFVKKYGTKQMIEQMKIIKS